METNEFLPLIIDGIILLIVIMSALSGYKKGFVQMVLSVVALIICITAANKLAMPAAQTVNEAFVHDAIVDTVTEYLSENTEKEAAAIIEQLPDGALEAAQEAGISLEALAEKASDKETLRPECDELITKVEDVAILPVLKLVCFAAIYFVLRFICSLIIGFVNKVFKLPMINGLNRTLGALCGGAKGLVAVAIMSLVIVSLQPLYASIPFGQAVEDTTLMNAIYDFTSQIIG